MEETKKNEEILEESNDEAIDESLETNETNPSNDEATVEEKPKTKKEIKKNKKRQKILNAMINPIDIKYVGPLSYRHLRMMAWVAVAMAQFIFVSNLAINITGTYVAPEWLIHVLSFVSNLSTPLFLIATFTTIISNHKSYKNALIIYSIAYVALSFGILLLYRRYITGLLTAAGQDADTLSLALGMKFGQKIQVNIFSDLLVLTLIHLFINYTPKKYFQGKKHILFRLLVILPIIYLVISYTLVGLSSANRIALPFEAYPFLTTKSPLVHLLFITLSINIKYREKKFISYGGTKEQYKAYLKTNRNSLHFSIQTSVLFAIFSVLDFITFIIAIIIFYCMGNTMDEASTIAIAIGSLQCIPLIIAIPFVMLFSYKKKYSNNTLDIIIPIIGIGLIALAYLEGTYEILMYLVTA